MQEKPENQDKNLRKYGLKPNARTAPGPGIEPGISGAQRRGRTAMPLASLLNLLL